MYDCSTHPSGVIHSLAGFDKAGGHEWPLKTEGQVTASKKMSPPILCKELNSTNSCMNLEVDPSPVEPPDEDPVLVCTLIAGFQKTQLSHARTPDPGKL